MYLQENAVMNKEKPKKPDSVTILIPVLNEEDAIGILIDEIRVQGYNNILLVDGYSVDQTVKKALDKNVKILYQKGQGKTGAIKTGIEMIDTPYIVIMDGDNTYNPNDIKKLLDLIEKYDQVIGVRKRGRENIPFLNRIGNSLLNAFFNILFNTNLSDILSGMYALKTSTAKKMKLETNGFDVEVEIISEILMRGKISEVPIDYRERIGQQKLQPILDGYKIFTTILKLGVKKKPKNVLKYSLIISIFFIIMLLITTFLLN
jgi:dolichol-phosphate mannosyltransferase